jgi:spermidine synthase
VVIADGARFVEETAERFDVVIVDSTDPIGPGAVLFTEAFYRGCRRILTRGGVLVTQCGNPSIMPDELVQAQGRQQAAGFALVDYYLTVVPTYVGGAMALGFATDAPALRLSDPAVLRARPAPEGLRYWTPEVQVGAFAHPAWMIDRAGH